MSHWVRTGGRGEGDMGEGDTGGVDTHGEGDMGEDIGVGTHVGEGERGRGHVVPHRGEKHVPVNSFH